MAGSLSAPGAARAALLVTPTTSGTDLGNALNPSGLTITSATIVNGADGQLGIYSGFTTPPVTIGNGIVLSSGRVSVTPAPPDKVDVAWPSQSYDMGVGGTAEFNAYGPGHIEAFSGAYDVAALQVKFSLSQDSQVKFDFVFGSVEYPIWTSAYTDALLVFLDGTGAGNQIAYDKHGFPVQVGRSFASLETMADLNTAFADPHGLLRKLTTTTSKLSAGEHTLTFEVGDVNDHILDSAAFIANLRTGSGAEGTEIEPVPEPSTGLAGLGALALLGMSVWRNRASRFAGP